MTSRITRKIKIVDIILLIAMMLQCFPSLSWGYDLKEKLTQNAAQKTTKKFTAPASLWPQNITESSIYIYWSEAKNSTGQVKYALYKDGELYTITTRRNAKVTGLSKGVTYTFYVIAKDLATGETKKSKILKQKTNGFVDESAKKDYYASRVKAKNDDIKRVNNWADGIIAKLITEPIDARITPQTNRGVKFTCGFLEGIANGVKDLGCITYSFLKHTSTSNLYASNVGGRAKRRSEKSRCQKIRDRVGFN